MSSVSYQPLETRGFVVIKGFLDEGELGPLRADFERGTAPEDFPFGFKLVRPRVLRGLWPRLAAVLEQVREQTSLRTDTMNILTISHYITTRLARRSSWMHQDFDLDFRLTREHRNTLNFWIPVVKPEAERSNLTLVPLDRLKARSDTAYRKVFDGGGCRFVVEGDETHLFLNEGEVLEAPGEPAEILDFDIEELAETPHLEAGDLLLLRGDVPHRTQDVETTRVAVSLRTTYSGKTIRSEYLCVPADDDPAFPILDSLRRCFAECGKDQVTVAEFVEFHQGHKA